MVTYQRNYMEGMVPEGKPFGNEQRRSYQRAIFDSEPLVPKTVTYEDIDREFYDFVKNSVTADIQGVEFPTFKLFSNQRFSEYSQTWKHTDDNGNLIVNFKTVTRETNPKPGKQQGGYYNIPGDRWYEYLRRDVLENNGDEAFEIYSIRQPFAVDLVYKVNVISTMLEYLNMFNTVIQDLFKSRQCYIRPNGHFLPMTLEDISDESEHEISERKFFSQSFSIRVMGYIIRPDDIRIDKFPKRVSVTLMADGEGFPKRVRQNVYEREGLEEMYADVEVDFKKGESNEVVFFMDTSMMVSAIFDDNVRSMKVFVNGERIELDSEFYLEDGMKVKIRIIRYDDSMDSSVRLSGRSMKCKIDTTNVMCDENGCICGDIYIVEPNDDNPAEA